MTETPPRSAEVEVEADPLVRRKWQLIAGFLVILVALATLAVTHHSDWHWLLFGWGVAVGVGGLALMELIVLASGRKIDVPMSRRVAFGRRRPIYVGCWLVGGTVFGTIAASQNLAWIDIVETVYTALMMAALASVATVQIRRQAGTGSPSAAQAEKDDV